MENNDYDIIHKSGIEFEITRNANCDQGETNQQYFYFFIYTILVELKFEMNLVSIVLVIFVLKI